MYKLILIYDFFFLFYFLIKFYKEVHIYDKNKNKKTEDLILDYLFRHFNFVVYFTFICILL